MTGNREKERSLRHRKWEMPMWVWIAIGVGSFLCFSLLVGFALARILGTIGREISELYETEGWATLPPTRASKDVKEQQPDEVGQTKYPRADEDEMTVTARPNSRSADSGQYKTGHETG